MTRSLAALALLALAACAAGGPELPRPTGVFARPLAQARPFPLSGELALLAGLQLFGPEDFGGLSAMEISPDGAVLALGDRGLVWQGRLRRNADGVMTGVSLARVGPLCGPDGAPLPDGARDSEGLARGPNGLPIVSFEGTPRIYEVQAAAPDAPCLPVRALPVPPGAERLEVNRGLEALASLPESPSFPTGALLALAEGPLPGETAYPLWLDDGRGWARLDLAGDPEFRPTDMVAWAEGALVLERAYRPETGPLGRLRYIEPEDLQGWCRVRGPIAARTVALLHPPLPMDNFEALALVWDPRREPGPPLLYLASDDNFSALQRTLLLQFVFVPEPRPPLAPRLYCPQQVAARGD